MTIWLPKDDRHACWLVLCDSRAEQQEMLKQFPFGMPSQHMVVSPEGRWFGEKWTVAY